MTNILLILQIVSIIATTIVGIILSRQIKSQKEIIEAYKGLVEATNPDKIVKLHQQEVDKLKAHMSFDINELKTQLMELANFTDQSMELGQKMADFFKMKGDFRKDSINAEMPHCRKLLEEIKRTRDQQKISSDNA